MKKIIYILRTALHAVLRSSRAEFTPPLDAPERCYTGLWSTLYCLARFCFLRTRAGFTLIETLVAVAVLLAGVIGPITLISHALFSVPFSRNYLVAHNLAQEGIELARTDRDDLALCALLGVGDTSNLASFNTPGYFRFDTLDTTTITCDSPLVTITVPRPIPIITLADCTTSAPEINIDSNGIYTYAAGTASGFKRCVQVCSPPGADPCVASADSDIPSGDQTEIISTVYWVERGVMRNVTLRDRLYKWLQ